MKTTRLYTLTTNMLLGELPTKQTIPPFTLQTSGEVVVLFRPCFYLMTDTDQIKYELQISGLKQADIDALEEAFADVFNRIPTIDYLSNNAPNTLDGFVCGLKLS